MRPLAVVLALVLGGSAAQAQDSVTPRPAGPRTIVGVVTDTSDDVLVDSVLVTIVKLKRETMSRADGTFRFDDVDPGTYEVRTRRFGYRPQERAVTVGASGGAMRFELMPFAQPLPTVVTSTDRGGLSGVIGDTSYAIVEGAEVAIVASDRRALTDSLGRFHVDVRPGKYMVRISKPGFATKLLSVTVPRDSGRKLVTTLAPRTAANNRDAMNMQALAKRLAEAVSARSKLYTREELAGMGDYDLDRIAIRGSGQPVADTCLAVIDGGPTSMPLWTLKAADLEMVEVYVGKASRPTITSIMGGSPSPGRSRPSACVTVYAWLRK